MDYGVDLTKLDPAILAMIPAGMPPEGVIPNFVNPESQDRIVAVVIYVTLPLMIFFVALRVYARLHIGHWFGADDYLCIVAAASVTVFCGVILPSLGDTIGPHQWDVPVSKLTLPSVERILTSVCIYSVSALFVKSTLLVLYLRLFRPSRKANIMIWGGIGACVLFYIIAIAVVLSYCTPATRILPTSPDVLICGQKQLNVSVGMGVFSTITDFYVLTIPISLVVELRLPLKRKFGVSAIFLTGLLACVCSVGSAVYRIKQQRSNDYGWDSVPTYAFSVGELNGGIICACLPVVFILFKKSTKSGPWASLVRYFQTHRSRKQSTDGLGTEGSSDFSAAGDRMAEKGQLPKIPRATMTGLRSFIHKSHRTQDPGAVMVHTELSTYNELASIDDEYHAQLLKTGRAPGGYSVTVASRQGHYQV